MVMMDMVIMVMAVFWILVLAAVAKADAEAHPCLAGWQGGPVDCSGAVSYTHLTLPTNREV